MKYLSSVSAALLVSAFAMCASAAPSRLCGEDGEHKDGDKKESMRLCGEDGEHKDGDKKESVRLCGEDHEDKKDDESLRPSRQCGEDHEGDKKGDDES